MVGPFNLLSFSKSSIPVQAPLNVNLHRRQRIRNTWWNIESGVGGGFDSSALDEVVYVGVDQPLWLVVTKESKAAVTLRTSECWKSARNRTRD